MRLTTPAAAAVAALALLAACAPSTGGTDAAVGEPTAEAPSGGGAAVGSGDGGAAVGSGDGAGATGSSEEAASDDPAGGEEVTLSVWSWRPEDEEAYTAIFDLYEEQHPGVTVEFRPYVNTEYNTILATGLTEEGGPDVAQLRAYGQLQPLVDAGQLLPLDDEVEELSAFPDEILEGARGAEDDAVYGVPFAVQTLQVFYNRALFEEQGLEEPETWDEFLAVLDAFEAAGTTPIAATALDPWMLPILHDTLASARYGGPAFQEAVLAGETDFTDPDYVASIEVVQSLQEYLPDDVSGVAYTDAQTLFTTGQAAMFAGGSFELGFFRTQAPDLDIGAFSVPPPPGSPVEEALVPGYVDGSYGVNAASDQQEAALELVRWMATEEFGQAFTDQLGQISAVPGVEPSDELLAEIVTSYEASPAPYLLLVDFRYGEPLGTELMGTGMQELFLGSASPSDVATDVQEGIAQWFQPDA